MNYDTSFIAQVAVRSASFIAQVAVRSATEFVASKSVVRQKWEGNARD